MSQYFTDFSEYQGLSDLRDADDWVGKNAPDADSFNIVSDSSYVGGYGVSFETDFTVALTTVAWESVGDVSQAEVVLRHVSNETSSFIHLRQNDSSESYASQIYPSSGTTNAVIEYDNNGSTEELGQGGSTDPAPAWQRFQVDGSDLKMRFWQDGSSEPSTWAIETTDSRISSGMVGFGTPYFTAGYTIDAFGVGTNGDSAPTEAGGQPPSAPTNLNATEQ